MVYSEMLSSPAVPDLIIYRMLARLFGLASALDSFSDHIFC